MHLDNKPVCTCRQCCSGHRWNEIPSARRVGGVGNDRQMSELPGQRHAGEIESVPKVWIEGADTTFAEHHLVVAACQQIFGCEQPFLPCRCRAAFQQDGLPKLTEAAKQREVLHIARAYLDHVDMFRNDFNIVSAQYLRHYW